MVAKDSTFGAETYERRRFKSHQSENVFLKKDGFQQIIKVPV